MSSRYSADRKSKRSCEENLFSCKSDIISLLKNFEIVHDYDEFWMFFLKYHEKKRLQVLNQDDLVCFNLNLTSTDLIQHASSKTLNHKLIDELILAVQAYVNFKQMESFNKLQKIRNVQMNLPVNVFQEKILKTVSEMKVTIIAGNTGCGKSTQIPQYLIKNYNRIVCTEPRRLACVSLCSRLKYETLNRYNHTIGYQIRFEKYKNKETKILFITEGILVRQMLADPLLSAYDVVILDEVHERHLQSDILLGLLKCLLLKREDLKLVLMSATINIGLFENYFQGISKVITIPGRLFPVKVIYYPPSISVSLEPKKMKVDATPYLEVLQMIDEKYKNEKGDVLIFMSGMTEIMCLAAAIEDYKSKSPNWIVLPLHSSLALAEQDKVFDFPPEGYRKCIISTNIAETSVTIDGIRFVIDSGKVKEMSYDPVYRMQTLKEFWISRSSAEQRKGRAGRTGPGICYRMYSESNYNEFEEYSTAEIKRVPLDSVLLQLIRMGLPDVRKFPFLEDPDIKNIENCILNLKQQNALTSDEKITEIGKTLASLPVEITIGKMLIIGSIFRQIYATIALASILSIPSPYTNNAFRNDQMEILRKDFESNHGDCIILLNLFYGWLQVKKTKGNSKAWCAQRGIEEHRFYEMMKLIHQFQEILTEAKFLEIDEPSEESSTDRRIRYGEVQILRKMKEKHSGIPERKRLKVDPSEYDEEDELAVDVKDIEFRLKNDLSKITKLLNNMELSSSKSLTIIKLVFCSSFYPKFALGDEFNYCRGEQLFHTKIKSHVNLHPLSHFGMHPDILLVDDIEVSVPNTKINYCGKRFSSEHKMICYSTLIETNKMYLNNMIQMPALQCFLFFAKTIDTSFNMAKIICDNWVLFEVLNPWQAQILIMKIIKLRKAWNRLISKKLTQGVDEEEVDDLTEDLMSFFNMNVSYAMKRLLPADLNCLYSRVKDFKIKQNYFDPDFIIKDNERKGGLYITEYLTYNCVVPNENENFYEPEEFNCRICEDSFSFNFMEKLEHMSACSGGSDVAPEKPKKKKPNSKEFECENCKEKFNFTTVEILRHKKNCK